MIENITLSPEFISLLPLLLLYIFIAVVVIQLFYYLGVFSSFSFTKENENNPKRIPISIIVYARNQSEDVKRLLPNLVNQNYFDFELVLIDNASTDETLDIFKEYAKMYSNIRICHVENNETFWNNKKYAQTLGIKASKNEYLLFIDAEQHIDNEFWIISMASNFTLNKTIILGPSMYFKTKGFLNKIIRFDTVFAQLHSFSWANYGAPFSYFSKNIGYKKEEFYKQNGYITHMNNRLGERELFLNEASVSKNTTFTTSKNAFVYLQPFTSLNEWQEKKNEDEKMLSELKLGSKFKVRLFNITQILFLILAIALLTLQIEWIITTIIISLRYLICWLVLGKSLNKFKQKDLIWLLPILEIHRTINQTKYAIKNLFRKNKTV